MKRVLSRTWFILAAVCLLLFSPFVLLPTAHAEVYSIGDDVPIVLEYGEIPSFVVTHINDSEQCYLIVSCLGSKEKNGAEFSLTDEQGRVTATPGYYYMEVNGSDKVIATTEDGTPLEGVTCSGRIRFEIRSKSLSLDIAAEDLVKTYGDEMETLPWSFRNQADRDDELRVRFTSLGFASTAAVGGSYPVSALSLTRGEEDVTANYAVTVYVKDSSDEASVTVEKKPLVFSYEQQLVEFNDFLLSDGESVYSMDKTGANGDLVTLFFRLKEEESVLTIGEYYEIEPYRYVVTPSEGDPVSYDMDDPSNYDVSADFSSSSVVQAKIGSVTLYQDESKKEARQGEPSYVWLSESALSLTYSDPSIKNFKGEITIEKVELYPNIKVDLTFSFDCDEETVPTGSYPLTLVSFSGSGVSSVSAESDLCLVVRKCVVGTLSEVFDQQYGFAENFSKEVSFVYGGDTYSFTLTASTVGLSVGSEVPIASAVCDDDNVILNYEGAWVKIVKRSKDVSIVAKEGADSLIFGKPYAPCSVYMFYGKTGEILLPETLAYSYTQAGESLVKPGLPEDVGSYVVTCVAESEKYAPEPLQYELTIKKRPVAARFEITSSEKTYGEVFVFSKETRLTDLYFFDESVGAENRSENGLVKGSIGSVFGGSGLASAGGESNAKVGTYRVDASGLTSTSYEIKKLILYDLKKGEEVDAFTVKKASAPGAVKAEYEISGRAVSLFGTLKQTSLQAELSEKSDFSNKQEATGETSATFSGLKYGVTYYARLRVSDPDNYENPTGEWSETISFAIVFPKPTCKVVAKTSDSLTFSAEGINLLTSAKFEWQHSINGGVWKDGLVVTELAADTLYTVRIRARNNAVSGHETELKDLRTLRAAVQADKVRVAYDAETGTLTAESDLELELRLLDEDNFVLEDWSDASSFTDIRKGALYFLEVREAAGKSDVTRIEVNTSPEKKSSGSEKTKGSFLSDWFLVVYGGGVLLLFIIFLIAFARNKRSVDRTELGGKL